jgi:WD40 repeat protein
MAIRNTRPNPYVGPRAFRTGEQLYGRDWEVRELLNHLIAERIVLLHSPSGAGKTSLIRAGLVPHLEAEGFRVLPIIRVNQELPVGVAANRYTYSVMLSLEEELAPEAQAQAEKLAEMDLVAYLERRKLSAMESALENSDQGEVLIFDQFEEILTIEPTDTKGKAAFFAQLGTALRDRWRWALFSMREDYMAALSPYLRPVPTRFRSTYRLDLLSAGAARQAIQRPVSDKGLIFTDEAATKLVDDLRSEQIQLPDGSLEERHGPHVEPVQLQVVCFRLWQNLAPDDTEISIEDIESVGDVNQSLSEYYAERVAAVSEDLEISERSIRDWFDNQLITKTGIRSQVIMEPESSGGLLNVAIQQLRNTHLVRAEKRRGVTWFELAHDRLVRPVREDNAAWFQANLSLLQRQAALWEEQGRPAGLLLRKKELVDAEAWAAVHPDELTPTEVEFLNSCQQAKRAEKRIQAEQELRLETAQKLAEAEKRRAEEQAAAAKQLRQRLILATAAMLLVLVLAIMAALFWNRSSRASSANATLAAQNAQIADANANLAATNAEIAQIAEAASTQAVGQKATAEYNAQVAEQNQAEAKRQADLAKQQTTEAQRQARIALAGELAAQSRAALERYPLRSLLLAVESVKVPLKAAEPEPPAARQALYESLANAGGIVLKGHADDIWTLAFSPDGHWLATAGKDKRVYLWDVRSSDPASDPLALQKRDEAQVGHQAEVTSLAFSPDGHWLASGSRDKTAILWDLSAENPGTSGVKLEGNTNIIDVVSISPDGRWLATGDRNGLILLWDLTAARIEASARVLGGHQGDITSLAFSPTGRWLASGSTDTTVLLWDLTVDEINEENALLLDQDDQVLTLAFSPNGRWLATGNKDATVWVWDLAGNEVPGKPTVLLGHEEEIRTLAFSFQGDHLASAGLDGTVRLWQIRAFGPAQNATVLRDHGGGVLSLAFSPDGRWLASGSTDFTGRLWDLSQRDPGRSPLVLKGHEETIRAVAFSPDGRWLATGGNDHVARLWDMRVPTIAASPLMLVGHERNVRALTFTPNGRWLASAADDAQIRLWDLDSEDPLSNVKILEGHSDDIRSIAVSPDGRWLASGGGDRNVLIWDLSQPGNLLHPIKLGRHGSKIWVVVFSPDGRWLASASRDTTLRLWDMTAPAPNQNTYVLEGSKGEVLSAVFSPDGRWLASGGGDGIARLWDLSGEKPASEPIGLSGHEGAIRSVAMSPDGRWLATAGDDKRIRLWDLSSTISNRIPLELKRHTDVINLVAFSPDGRWVASGSRDGTTRLWDLRSPDFPDEVRVHTLRRHLEDILSLSFSPDGRWLVTTSVDSTTRLWDLAGEEPGANPILMTVNSSMLRGIGDVWSSAISPDGRWLATGSRDGMVRVWSLSLEELKARVCAMTGRNLTMDEWLEFQPGVPYEKTCLQWP